MKLNRQASDVTRGGVASESTFTIATSAHAFEILSSGLYTDSVAAIVRELSCNAYDAHVMAGNKETPFDIHVPSRMEPWFAIRDYGTGLSKEDITGVYTTYFQSTKSDSDDFIGALGLGSKSPFSYASEFQVTSYFEGVAYKYAIFLNEAGVPSVALMGEVVTTEPNGIEVRLPSEERNRFAQAIGKYLAYFTVKPNILGTVDSEVTDLYSAERLPSGSELDSEGEWFITSKDGGYYSSRVGIIYGQVPYPANIDRIVTGIEDMCTEQQIQFYKSFSNRIVFIFNVGELSITANREELKYDGDTLNSIAARIKSLHEKFFGNINDIINNFADNDSLYKTNQYLMASVFGGETKFYGALDFARIDNDTFTKMLAFRSRWGSSFSHDINDAIESVDADLHEVLFLEAYYSPVCDELRVRAKKGKSVDCLGISTSVAYYVIDETRNGLQKAKQSFLNTHKGADAARYQVVIKPRNLKECGDAAHALELEDIKAALCNPDFTMTSTLDYVAPERKTRTGGVAKQIGTVFSQGPYWNSKSNLDMNAGGIYVYLAGGTKMYKGSSAVWDNDIFKNVQHSPVFIERMVAIYNSVHGTEFKSHDLIGVSAADIKAFDKDTAWHNIVDTVETYVKANQVELHREWQESKTFNTSVREIGTDTPRNFYHIVKDMASNVARSDRQVLLDQLGSDNDYYKMMIKYLSLEIKNSSLISAVHGHSELLETFGSVDYRKASDMDNRYTFSIEAELNTLCEKYTMLSMMERYYSDATDTKTLQILVEYITMIDNK